MRRFIPALLVFALSPSAAFAESEKLILDKPHTQIIFAVSHLGYADSYGKFLDYEGEILFDQAQPEKSGVDVTIKTASLDLGDEKWNAHMKNADFFDVEKFPVMTFKSTGITVTGEKTADIAGDLTIKGVTKPVTLKTVYNKTEKHPKGERIDSGFSARTTIKRSDFGIAYGLPMIPDDVNIILEVEAYKEDKTAAGTGNP